MTREHKCATVSVGRRLWVRSPLEEIIFLMFTFSPSVDEVKSGAEFRSENSAESGEWKFLNGDKVF